jgi:hypothetical protein
MTHTDCEVNYMLRSVALTAAIVLAVALPGAAQIVETTTVIPSPAAPAAGCPAESPHALAVAFGSGFYRTDLQQAALAAVSDAAQKAGLTLVAPQANVLQAIPGATSAVPVNGWPSTAVAQPQTLCTPTVVLMMSTGPWSAFTMPALFNVSATRYSEPLTVGAVLGLPDRRIFQATSQQTAAWYVGYVPLPTIGTTFLGGMPVATPQTAAEQQTIARGVTAVLSSLLPNIPAP